MRKLFILISAFCSLHLMSQEFNAQFKVSTPKLQTADPKVFRALEDDARKFINTRLWTPDKFQQYEKIKCNFLLTIREEVNSTTFKAELLISASRPVFGSNYETTIFNYQDRNVVFNYEPNNPLNYVQNTFTDRLTATLAFYSNLILGLYYDSFQNTGGNDYFQICQNIVNTIPSTMEGEGWKPSDDTRNRYWLLENIQSPRLRTMRTAFYEYHIKGLDIMNSDPVEGRKALAKALAVVDEGKRNYPTAVWTQVFFDDKISEIADVFKKGELQQRQAVHAMLSRIDPSSASKYSGLLQ